MSKYFHKHIFKKKYSIYINPNYYARNQEMLMEN